MPTKVHLVRHAQGVHNLGHEYWSLIDPPLTETGRDQCSKLNAEFPYHSKVELVVSSPLCRAIYTAAESFRSVFDSRPNLDLVVLPGLQEISDFPCDVGSKPAILKEKTKDIGVNIDWTFLHEGWTSKDGQYAPITDVIRQRARAVRSWLCARPEKEIAVVTHGAFLHYLTEDWEDSCVYEGTGWSNTEHRTYGIMGRDKDDVRLLETAESRQRRAKTGPVPAREVQQALYERAQQTWSVQGYLLCVEERERPQQPPPLTA